MKETKLPSGKVLLTPEDVKATIAEAAPVAEASDMESTSGTLSLDVDGQCPKCQKQMGRAKADGEEVYYCGACRVSAPLVLN